MTYRESVNIMAEELFKRGVHSWHNSLIEDWKAKTKNDILRSALCMIQRIRQDIDEQQLLFRLE